MRGGGGGTSEVTYDAGSRAGLHANVCDCFNPLCLQKYEQFEYLFSPTLVSKVKLALMVILSVFSFLLSPTFLTFV